jgi:hypothetical protein
MKKSTIYNTQSTIHNRCDNCFFSVWLMSPDRPALMCMQRPDMVGRWQIVALAQSCTNFYPSEIFKLGATAVRRIPLTKGKFALVDAEDYYQLVEFRWQVSDATGNTSYATGRRGGKTIKMHRFIMDAPAHLVVDHIDHNGLNNCKANLRLCTSAQNSRNCAPNKGASSKYKGVIWNKHNKKWRASIDFNKKRRHIGCFENEIDAARAYDEKAAELFGEFGHLNFPANF